MIRSNTPLFIGNRTPFNVTSPFEGIEFGVIEFIYGDFSPMTVTALVVFGSGICNLVELESSLI